MSSGVEDKIEYLDETKGLIKQSIKQYDDTISDSTLFRDYPEHIQNAIDKTIIPQSVVDDLALRIEEINGEEVDTDGDS